MNLGQKALQILRTVAPTVALAVGGPFGPIAAAAVHAALGSSDDASAAAALVAATPDQLLALKNAENAFTEQMKTLGIQEEKLSFDDTANARAREAAVKDSTPQVLAYLTTAGFFAALIGTFYIPIPDASKAIIFSMIGSLGTVWINQQGYYFGSSAGSAAKTDTINKIAAAK